MHVVRVPSVRVVGAPLRQPEHMLKLGCGARAAAPALAHLPLAAAARAWSCIRGCASTRRKAGKQCHASFLREGGLVRRRQVGDSGHVGETRSSGSGRSVRRHALLLALAQYRVKRLES